MEKQGGERSTILPWKLEGFCSIMAGAAFAGVSLILVVCRAVLIRSIQEKRPMRRKSISFLKTLNQSR